MYFPLSGLLILHFRGKAIGLVDYNLAIGEEALFVPGSKKIETTIAISQCNLLEITVQDLKLLKVQLNSNVQHRPEWQKIERFLYSNFKVKTGWRE